MFVQWPSANHTEHRISYWLMSLLCNAFFFVVGSTVYSDTARVLNTFALGSFNFELTLGFDAIALIFTLMR